MKIGIIGNRRVGKSTVANYLEENYGFSPFALGDKLKKEFHKNYPHIQKYPKPARGYQLFGQLQRYTQGDYYWIEELEDTLELTEKYVNSLIQYNNYPQTTPFKPMITDIRQQNEYEHFRDEGYLILRIVAATDITVPRMILEGDDLHNESSLNFETESALNNVEVDYEITNSGTLEELYAECAKMMQIFKNKN